LPTGALKSVTIINFNGVSRVSAYELDHLQIVATGDVIPEPGSLALLAAGAAGLAVRWRAHVRRLSS